jgi:hypothetical protein
LGNVLGFSSELQNTTIKMKTIIITGANSGLGIWTTKPSPSKKVFPLVLILPLDIFYHFIMTAGSHLKQDASGHWAQTYFAPTGLNIQPS